eukprot:708754_1
MIANKFEPNPESKIDGEHDVAAELHPSRARKLLLGTISADLLLYILFRGEIPHRDYVMCRVGFVLTLLLTSFESPGERSKRLTSTRFRKIFATLSTMEVIFTILIPWLIILEGIFNKTKTNRNGHLLASHLFVFQAQIAGECMIALAGERRNWLIFPFTCVVNAYRGVTIWTWITRVVNESQIGPRDVILPSIAMVLWIYSSFVFIPRVWYPQLTK